MCDGQKAGLESMKIKDVKRNYNGGNFRTENREKLQEWNVRNKSCFCFLFLSLRDEIKLLIGLAIHTLIPTSNDPVTLTFDLLTL